MMIDDASDKDILHDMDMTNVTVIESEYPGAGELLPYYYLWKLKPFKKAIILHDSMFIKEELDISDSKFLWHFSDHRWDRTDLEVEMLLALKNRKILLDRYCRKDTWIGCFGAAMVIDVEHLSLIMENEGVEKLLPMIKGREHRMAIERVMALLMQVYGVTNSSIIGCIHDMEGSFHYTMNDYIKGNIPPMAVIKVWSGR